MIQSTSSNHAKKYFTDALSKSDYYISDVELQGRFGGKLAKRLGLGPNVNKDDFHALCDNRHPVTGKPLTPYTKHNRTTGYDINYHVPKSVSIAHVMSGDDRILEAFRQSVNETMEELEGSISTRVRKNKHNDERITGELVWGEFIHQTARGVDQHSPDPHLHAHCFVFNATWDATESKYKAAQFREVKRNMPYYQAAFHKRLADNLSRLGYKIRLTAKSFELEAVPEAVIKHFSKRTNEIGQIAKEKGITDAKELDALGAKTRSKKQKGLSMEELMRDWLRQIEELDIKTEPQESGKEVEPLKVNCETIIDQTLQHCFERASVVDKGKLLRTTFRFAIGYPDIKIGKLSKALWNDSRLIRIKQKDQILCTTMDVLKEEQTMVALAKDAIGKVKPIKSKVSDAGKDQQQRVINEVLTTKDRVCLVRGVAGSGKTTLMKRAIESIEEEGIKVTVVAPTSTAARGVLRSEGHANAETVAKLLIDKNMQNSLKDGLLWVDEAGLLSNKEMLNLLALSKKQNARLVLAGDTRQHSAVSRGDALRILNTVAKLTTAEVNIIRRQQNELYRKAIEDLSMGDIEAGFEKLDALGAIKPIDSESPTVEIVDSYLEALDAKRSVLVVSPTHSQGERITKDIRQALKDKKLLGQKDVSILRYKGRNFTEAEKSDYKNYQKGDAIQFNLPTKGAIRGSVWLIDKIENDKIKLIDKDGRDTFLQLDKPASFDVFEIGNITLTKGDKVRVTKNSFEKKSPKKEDQEKSKRMDNGLALEVISIRRNGDIKLRNPVSKTEYTIDKDFGHITHDYCVTSHASQGKTCDEVLIYQPAATFGATNSKQFYVSASRAKHIIRVFTDDREELLEAAKAHGNRMSALELVNAVSLETEISLQKKRLEADRSKQSLENYRVTDMRKPRNYEPSI